MGNGNIRSLWLLVLILFTTFADDYEAGILGANADVVTYDHRALIINGQRRILISASLHYPRATPEMWPDLISKAKNGGVDVIETYVFWNLHEPSQGNYNFEGRYDLPKFLKLVQEAGLYVNLRIGPYVCAEWNFGGFPVWLLDIPNIHFRTNNEPFKTQMQGFVTKVVNLMKGQQLFASQGGPIILAQIENEYGDIDAPYGSAGKNYMIWAASMAQSLNIAEPWIMCQQSDAPSYIINTCNGFYCDGWSPNSGKPKMWTEDWSGWFQKWGEAVPSRPVEDVAFAVARFFELGGTFQNYYMYFGGTNFGRTSGGPYITTSYDYDAPVDEYGKLRQRKWGHLRDLHKALKLCETALVFGDLQHISLGNFQEAHVYSNGSNICAAFLANFHSEASATVTFKGQTYELPAWSVSILSDCNQVVFNTAKVNAQTSMATMEYHDMKITSSRISNAKGHNHGESASTVVWQFYHEPVGVWSENTIQVTGLLEQISTTKDQTDYLWYTTSVQVSQSDSESTQANLYVESMRDVVHIFINGVLAGSANTVRNGVNGVVGLYSPATQAVKLKAGTNQIAILSATVGLQNYGAYFETWGAGINGSVLLSGLPSGTQSITRNLWTHQVGLQGEKLSIYTMQGAQNVKWSSESLPQNQPLTWYKMEFDAPAGDDPVALDLGTLGKGQVWVNGESLGRYWPSMLASQNGCTACDYGGVYSQSKCRSGCGQPSQQWYHVPRAWLNPTGNLLVLFEEIGGDPSGISLGTRAYASVCSHISETNPPPLFTSLGLEISKRAISNVTTAQLECAAGYKVSSITFASYGTPQGTCANYHEGKCHAKSSLSVVAQECIGQQHCSLSISSKKFGGDPCPGIPKSLAIEAFCNTPID